MSRFALGTLLVAAAAVSLLPLSAEVAPPQPVGEFVSEPGEALGDFILRIAPALEEHTKDSGHEVCGMVAQSADSERYGLRLGTTTGAMTCSMSRSNVPEGMRALKVSVHSHSRTRSVIPTSADVTFYAENPLVSGRMVKRGRPEKVGGAYFSNGDYAEGGGDVVAEGQTLTKRRWLSPMIRLGLKALRRG